MAEALLIPQLRVGAYIVKFIKNSKKKKSPDQLTATYFEARIKLLERYFDEFYARHQELFAYETEQKKHEYFANDKFAVVESAYIDALAELTADVERLRAPAPIADGSQRHGMERPIATDHIKVPRVTLPTFTGNQNEWESYKQRFNSLIHSKREYSDVDKLQYLLSSVEGKAAVRLRGLEVTAENYKVAWEILTSRYDNVRKRLNTHLEALIQLSPVRAKNVQDLEELLDTVIVAVRGLDKLGCNIASYDNWFVHCISKKLDSYTRETWEISQEDIEGFYTYKDLLAFLYRRIESLDSANNQTDSRTVGGSPSQSSKAQNQKGKAKRSDYTSANSVGVSDASSKANKNSPSCHTCQGKHWMNGCDQFRAMNPRERFNFCKKEKLCLNCLRKTHSVSECKSANRCIVYKQPHHTMLHFDAASGSSSSSRSVGEISTPELTQVTSEISPSVGAHLANVQKSALLATATLIVCDNFGKSFSARALIDPGAQRSFVSERLAAQLTAERRSVSVDIFGVGGQVSSKAKSEILFSLRSRINSSFECTCSALILPELTCMLPHYKIPVKDWPHLRDLRLADPQYYLPGKIDLILGADLYGLILQEGFARGEFDAPIAQNTVFGWILTGVVPAQHSTNDAFHVTAFHAATEPSLDHALTRFWEIEEIPMKTELTPEEEYCDQYFLSTYYRNEQGRFVVRLPFARREAFPDSRDIAVACLRRSEKRRRRDPEFQNAYSAFMREYLQLGHMKAADPPDDDFHYYLPHHGIFRADSNKIRVVFNASQKSASGNSLNDLLLPGRKLQPDVTLVILRWRFGRVALITDIVKMFRQYLIHPDDIEWQRLVWREDVDALIKDYVALTLTYGMNCAPYLAMMVLIQLAKDGRTSHPLASRLLLDETYIDDIFLDADDTNEARNQRDQLIDLLASAGMHLGKWASSHPALLQGLPGVEICDLPSPSGDVVSALGVKWDTGADEFLFNTALPPLPPLISKRSVLSDTARLFDPLGLIGPVLILAKILLQDMWINHLEWDVPLPQELLGRWLDFRASLHHLPEIRIPRWIGTARGKEWHLHGFADASMRAYAAVIYASVQGSPPSILMSKTRVAPVKVVSLPRLELCGAALLVRLTKHAISGMHHPPTSINFWSDSKVVLDWLKSHPTRWPTFVANRVSEITTSFPEAVWRHVGSKDNPADCASRGMSSQELSCFTLWWQGPPWLTRPHDWPTQMDPNPGNVQALVTTESEETVLSALEKYSSFTKILRILAYVMRWRSRSSRKMTATDTRKCRNGSLTAREILNAKFKLFSIIQHYYFDIEIKLISAGKMAPRRSPLARLSPFLDDQGLLRVGGRLHNAPIPLAERHPIILPHCDLVTRMVEEIHRFTLHGGIQLMKNVLRRSCWIIKGNRLISAVYHKCTSCIRYGASPLQQQMAPLPAERLTPGRPFATVGLDYAGPFPVLFSKGRGAKSTKGYIAIFICLVVKAIHIEVVSDLTTKAFLAAFSRFTARRGLCSTIFSDNGTTFRGADAELQRLFREATFDREIHDHLATRGIEWKFIPPRAPHFGGLWEAAVRSFKHHFRRVIGGVTLTFEELSTLAAKVEACLNSRPLCPLTNEAQEPVALTPGHFLVGSAALTFLEPPQDLTKRVSLNSRWQLVSKLQESFWARLRKEALSHLQQRNKWLKIQPNLQPGDVVIVTDELAPPATWPLAVIEKTHPGDDQRVRVVTLRTSKSSFIRPIAKLIRLPSDEDTNVHFAWTSAVVYDSANA